MHPREYTRVITDGSPAPPKAVYAAYNIAVGIMIRFNL